MENSQIIFTLFATVAFCLGWRMVTDENQLLYFLRKPFENLGDEIENQKFMYLDYKTKRNLRKLIWLQVWYYITKPTLICITCMASVWGAVLFIYFNGISPDLIGYLIFNCISASFLNTFVWVLFSKLNK